MLHYCVSNKTRCWCGERWHSNVLSRLSSNWIWSIVQLNMVAQDSHHTGRWVVKLINNSVGIFRHCEIFRQSFTKR